jgi:VIT1/CCC1 family predicted Fe2+/Mn2+ transporter
MAATQIDPRGPRFGATITNIASVVAFYEALDSNTTAAAAAIFAVLAVLFLIGATLGTSKHPFGWLYRTLVKPRISAPKELEDSRPPQFAQAVGLFVTVAGLVLFALNVPNGLLFAIAALFLASALQAYFGYCLGCQMYLGLKRIGVIRSA